MCVCVCVCVRVCVCVCVRVCVCVSAATTLHDSCMKMRCGRQGGGGGGAREGVGPRAHLWLISDNEPCGVIGGRGEVKERG